MVYLRAGRSLHRLLAPTPKNLLSDPLNINISFLRLRGNVEVPFCILVEIHGVSSLILKLGAVATL